MRKIFYESVLRKSMAWHDDRANSAGVIGNILNAQVNSLSNVAITVTAARLEGFGGVLVGVIAALVFSWPIALVLVAIAPLMLISSKIANKVKHKQYGLLQVQEKELKEADILLSDSISNFKTVASIAHQQILVDKFDKICEKRVDLESKEANCEGFQFGFSEFMKNFAFGIIYLAQAYLVFYFEDAEVLEPDRMFTAMFTLMFGVFAFMGAMATVQDKDKAIDSARKMFMIIETPSPIDPLALE